jgi:hypothetical protein
VETLLGQAVDPELVAGVGADDGQLVFTRELTRAARVVDVRMREPDRLDRQSARFCGRADAVEFTARVDDRSVVRFVAPDQGAVLLEGGDGEGFIAEHAALSRPPLAPVCASGQEVA